MLENLVIQRTDNSPHINFDLEKGLLELEGECRPENVKLFFDPILEWIEKYKIELKPNRSQKTINTNFRLEYFNSSSAKYILELMNSINQIEIINLNIVVIFNWFVNTGDDDLIESGKELSLMSNIRINIIQTK